MSISGTSTCAPGTVAVRRPERPGTRSCAAAVPSASRPPTSVSRQGRSSGVSTSAAARSRSIACDGRRPAARAAEPAQGALARVEQGRARRAARRRRWPREERRRPVGPVAGRASGRPMRPTQQRPRPTAAVEPRVVAGADDHDVRTCPPVGHAERGEDARRAGPRPGRSSATAVEARAPRGRSASPPTHDAPGRTAGVQRIGHPAASGTPVDREQRLVACPCAGCAPPVRTAPRRTRPLRQATPP